MSKWKTILCAVLAVFTLSGCSSESTAETDLGEMTRVNGPASCSFGSAEFVIPEGYTIENAQTSDGAQPVLFRKGDTVIGGMTRYSAPEGFAVTDYFGQEFLKAMELPEASDETLGSSGGGNPNGIGSEGWSLEYFSDVPPGTPRAVHTFHQFYVLADNVTIVDIWFDLLEVDSLVKDTILASVEIPEIGRFEQNIESRGDAPFELCYLPQGYDLVEEASGRIVLTNGDLLVGGIYQLQMPDFRWDPAKGNLWDWVEALNVPENVPEERFMMEVAGGEIEGMNLRYASYGRGGIEETVHYFFEGSDVVFDLWFDVRNIPEEEKLKILEGVRYDAAEEAAVTMPFGFGIFPEGYFYVPDADGNVVFFKETTAVGGIIAYPIPEGVYDAGDTTFFWLENMGIPDFEDPALCYMGGMTSGDNGWLAEFASDVPPGEEITVSRRHHFYPIDGVVYDIWFDMMLLDLNTSSDILAEINLPQTAQQEQPETQSAEDRAFEMTRAVLDAVAEGGCTILQTEYSATNEGPKGYERRFSFHEGNLLYTSTVITEGENKNEAGEYYNRYALLYVEDTFFDNQDTQGQSGEIQWQPAQAPETIPTPWMEGIVWNKTFATYIDTITDDEGECLMFRFNKMYEDKEGYADVYWVNFHFDHQGNFRYVQLEVNLHQDNAFTLTESFVSLDPEETALTIEAEAIRAKN